MRISSASDDNITSKAGRCDLVSAGLAFHEAGLSSLTPDGARLAREWDLCSLYARRDRRWYLKVRTNARPSISGRPPGSAQGYRMFKSMSTRKLSSQAARLSLPRNEVFVSG